MISFLRSAPGVVGSLALYLAIASIVAVFVVRDGQRVLRAWWHQPVGPSVAIIALLILLGSELNWIC